MSRMFRSITSTWNVFKGCEFDCSYCNARKAALTRFRKSPRYQDGFTPRLIESELARQFMPGALIFVSYMGDISFATAQEFVRILSRIHEFPETDFLIQTKNPEQIVNWLFFWSIMLPKNAILGTTLETNRDTSFFSKAPPPLKRFEFLTAYPHNRKFVSIEPVMDFDIEPLVSWVRIIKPEIVEIGADNYHNNLPEPPWEKVEELVKRLRRICPRVEEKVGLERLKGEKV